MIEPCEFDAAYVDRLRQKDPTTQRHFFAHFRSVLVTRLQYKLRSPQLVEDVAQETFLRVLAHIEKGTVIEKLPAFLHSVSQNVMLEFLRGEKRHMPGREEMPELPDDAAGAHDRLVTKERKQAVRQILDTMPEKDRHLLERLFLDEADREEVCAEMQVDGDYLRVLLHRAKNKFRESLEKGTLTQAARATLSGLLLLLGGIVFNWL